MLPGTVVVALGEAIARFLLADFAVFMDVLCFGRADLSI
jgi:hypothetical protein